MKRHKILLKKESNDFMKLTQNNIPQFFTDLAKSKTTKAVLFYGGEEALILDYVMNIKDILKNHLFETIDAESESYLQNLQNEINTESMFGEQKLLYINNFKKTDGKKLTDILKNITPENNNFIIITSLTGLDTTNIVRKMFETVGHFASIGVYAENDATLKSLAKSVMDNLGMQYEPSIPEIIARMFSNNRSIMKQEIHKLHTYNLNTNYIITEQIAQNVLSEESESNIFDLQTTLFNKNLQHTLNILNNAQEHGIHPNIVWSSLAGYIRKIYIIKRALLLPNAESIDILIRNSGVFWQQVPTLKKHINHYSMSQVVEIISKLNTLELQIRNSTKLAYNYIQNFAINQCS